LTQRRRIIRLALLINFLTFDFQLDKEYSKLLPFYSDDAPFSATRDILPFNVNRYDFQCMGLYCCGAGMYGRLFPIRVAERIYGGYNRTLSLAP